MNHSRGSGWHGEGKDLLRAIAGGAIFGMPLLYTMEVWHHGATFSPLHMFVLLGAILLVNLGFSYAFGMRQHTSFLGAFSDAVSAVGVSLILVLVILLLIGQLRWRLGFQDSLGKILLAALVVSVGINFVQAKFQEQNREGQSREAQQGDADRSRDIRRDQWLQGKEDLRDAGATIAGATVFAFNVAPTEEVVLIASNLSALQQIALLVASLGFCYVILFASEFWQRPVYMRDSLFQHPVAETLTTTALSLIVAALLLIAVGSPESTGSMVTFISCVVTLGLPAVVGGAAGRLVV